MRGNSNYEKNPALKVSGNLWKNWNEVRSVLKNRIDSSDVSLIAVECYTGVDHAEIAAELRKMGISCFIDTAKAFKSEEEVVAMTAPFMTDDVLFGFLSNLGMEDFFDSGRLAQMRADISEEKGTVLVYGHGATVVAPQADLIIYADMARWEIQQRFRTHSVCGLGVDNRNDAVSLQYKRGYFIDWKVCDSLKCDIYDKVDFWLDTHTAGTPSMIDTETFRKAMKYGVTSPFRVVPFFDPAPWGGQWMKEVMGLDGSKPNYGWCFDCVPEENSLLLDVDGELFKMPSVNLVNTQARRLLGEAVEARFGRNFPIRFDFLDTMGGGNLSLQVHPTIQFAHDHFGLHYTQDESYYLVDAAEDAKVYLGLKNDTDREEMMADLRKSRDGKIPFDADKYVNVLPARKHDHFLIPSGTIHCSGTDSVVLEISSTPNLFTFKLWDWDRLGLDGKPRPINVDRGEAVIDWTRNTDFVNTELANIIETVAEGDGWMEEKTGLHANEFIETRRHWFEKPVLHNTAGGVNVLNLVEGEEAVIESPTGAFEPYVVHYAETFIIPAAVGDYIIRPHGLSEGKRCVTIKAFVRQ